jgi:hypothetical protein
MCIHSVTVKSVQSVCSESAHRGQLCSTRSFTQSLSHSLSLSLTHCQSPSLSSSRTSSPRPSPPLPSLPHFPMSDPTPLIDRRRSTSKDRLPHSSHPASNPSSPFGSPIASPPLKSALRHYPDPFTSVRPSDADEHHVVVPMELPPPVTSDSPALASTYSRRVGFDTFVAGASLEALGSATGGGTGESHPALST